MLGNVNWCCISTTKRNYHCAMQYTIASNALIKRTLERTDIKNSATLLSFRILSTISNFWLQEFWNSIWSGTQEHCSIRNAGIIFDHHTSSIFLQCPLPISTISNTKDDHQLSVKQVQLGSNKCFRCQARLNVVTRMLSSFLLFLSVGRNLILFPIFIREPPQFEWSAVRHSHPIVVLVTIFFKEKVVET